MLYKYNAVQGPDGCFRTGSHQLVWHYTLQLSQWLWLSMGLRGLKNDWNSIRAIQPTCCCVMFIHESGSSSIPCCWNKNKSNVNWALMYATATIIRRTDKTSDSTETLEGIFAALTVKAVISIMVSQNARLEITPLGAVSNIYNVAHK